MTASEILVNRYGLSPEDAALYSQIAEQELREYLNYTSEESMDRFASTVASIASLHFKKDKAIASASAGAGAVPVKSESFSEGGVSVSKTYLAGGDLYTYYDDAVAKVLDGVKRFRRARVVPSVGGA